MPDQQYDGNLRIERVLWGPSDSGWAVTKASFDDAPPQDAPPVGPQFGLVGDLGAAVAAGDVLFVRGDWVNDAKYGLQLKAKSAARVLGGSEADLAAFLARMPQVGRARAWQILRKLGGREATLQALEGDAHKLCCVDGVTPERADDIAEAYREQQGVADALVFLGQIGLGERLVAKAIDRWEGRCRQLVEHDPYVLMQLSQVGFKRADEIARSALDVARDDPRRCRAAASLAVQLAEDEGHVWSLAAELAGEVERSRLAERIRKDTELSAAELHKGLALAEQPGTDALGRVQPPLVVRRGPADEDGAKDVHLRGDADRLWSADLDAAERDLAVHLGRLVHGTRRAAPAVPDCPVCSSTGKTGTVTCWGCGGSGSAIGTCTAGERHAPVCGKPVYCSKSAAHDRHTVCSAGHTDGLVTGAVRPLDVPDGIWNFEPADEQAQAVESIAASRVIVITGGPGVGKTASVCAVLSVLEHNGIVTACTAPTGKAAHRMKEQTGRDASTIHRLLKYVPGIGFRHDDGEPEYDEAGNWVGGGPIDAGAVVVDEASMVDTLLFTALVRAIPDNARLIIVGDVDQLPSIGAGQVLRDLIDSGTVPVARLSRIFRQASESRIPYVARDINAGRAPDLGGTGDVQFIGEDDPERLTDCIVRAVAEILPTDNDAKGRRAFDPFEEVQVLAAQKSGPVGVETLNRALQQRLNPPGKDAMWIGGGYQAGPDDRVIHVKNNYKRMVFNGEMGSVVLCSFKGLLDHELEDALNDQLPEDITVDRTGRTDRVMVVNFGDRRIAYAKGDVKELLLGYAITIHKSQGSQFPCVVMPVHECHSFMLTRSLVYTGITRASEYVVLYGQSKQIVRAAQNTRGTGRRTTLAARLQHQTGPDSAAAPT